jgi:ubiquinone/menaquinone biosynthesis C-methylase UbiE
MNPAECCSNALRKESQPICHISMSGSPPVCDYEGSDYRARFWDNQGREYEDRVERIALRRLMPAGGASLIDIGAGFGRLAGEFEGYERVVLFDYSRSLLRQAQERLGDDPRFIFVAGDWYRMPFVSGLFDTLVQVRTIHHAADVTALLKQLARIAAPGGRYVLEYPNKRNLKAILRYWSGRQHWSPFQQQPVEFVELNFDFHPRWMKQQLIQTGFRPEQTLSVSHFRIPILKQLAPASALVAADGLLQPSGKWWQLSPSVFVASQATANSAPAAPDAFFACPACQRPLAAAVQARLVCPNHSCALSWRFDDGLYDFKEPQHLDG